MTHFLSLGGSDSLAALTSRLRDKGAEESSDEPSLVLVAADSLQHAEELVAGLPLALRRRTVLLGIDEGLAPMPSKGSLAELLERFQLLGALPADQTAKPTIDRFLGPKKDRLCELVGASYFKGFSSPNYAIWSRFPDVDAATFLLSLIAAFDADGRWLREGPDFPSRP